MALQQNGPAPYAPPKSVIDVVTVYRDKGMRTPFTLDVLTRAGVTESLAPRTLQSLRLLDLIDSEGNPTPEFQQAVRAPESEFKQALGDIIASAYGDALAFADPGTEGLQRVRDAFRTYTPVGQQERMVTLFLGLLDWCGLDTDAAKADMKERPKRSQPTRPKARLYGGEGTSPSPRPSLPAPLLSLLNDALPKEGEPWPEPKRDQFLKTFEALLDLYYPTTARAELSAGAVTPNGSEEEA